MVRRLVLLSLTLLLASAPNVWAQLASQTALVGTVMNCALLLTCDWTADSEAVPGSAAMRAPSCTAKSSVVSEKTRRPPSTMPRMRMKITGNASENSTSDWPRLRLLIQT